MAYNIAGTSLLVWDIALITDHGASLGIATKFQEHSHRMLVLYGEVFLVQLWIYSVAFECCWLQLLTSCSLVNWLYNLSTLLIFKIGWHHQLGFGLVSCFKFDTNIFFLYIFTPSRSGLRSNFQFILVGNEMSIYDESLTNHYDYNEHCCF